MYVTLDRYLNPSMTLDILKENNEYNMLVLFSGNANFSLNILSNKSLSKMFWDIIKNNRNDDWNEYTNNYYVTNFLLNPVIPFEQIMDILLINVENIVNDDLNWLKISESQKVTWDIVTKYKNINWNYRTLSSNPNITWEIVNDNQEYDWNYEYLSMNPNITWDIVKNNKLSIEYFARNVNMTLDIMDEIMNINDINLKLFIYNLTKNQFNYDPYYTCPVYKKKLVKQFINNCKEELIAKVCTPKRILNWNEDVLLNKENPLYGYTQDDINYLLN